MRVDWRKVAVVAVAAAVGSVLLVELALGMFAAAPGVVVEQPALDATGYEEARADGKAVEYARNPELPSVPDGELSRFVVAVEPRDSVDRESLRRGGGELQRVIGDYQTGYAAVVGGSAYGEQRNRTVLGEEVPVRQRKYTLRTGGGELVEVYAYVAVVSAGDREVVVLAIHPRVDTAAPARIDALLAGVTERE